MKYMLLIHQGTTPTPHDPEAWATLSQDEQNAVYAAYKAINETPGSRPACRCSRPRRRRRCGSRTARRSRPTARSSELKEAIGGYLFFEADDLDAAIELAATIPAASMGGAIEVRPIVEW